MSIIASEKFGTDLVAAWADRWANDGACPCWWGGNHANGHCCFDSPTGDCHDESLTQLMAEMPNA